MWLITGHVGRYGVFNWDGVFIKGHSEVMVCLIRGHVGTVFN